MIPGRELVMTLRVAIAASLDVGEVGSGMRRVIPITGGTIEGTCAYIIIPLGRSHKGR